MAEHEHGTMDYTDQKKTYEGFITFVTRACVVILVILVGMALFAS